MTNISKEVLQKIKKNKIKPKPRWQFELKNYSIWTIGVVSLVLGALITSIVIFILAGTDWQEHTYFKIGILKFFFTAFPYLWLTLLLTFIVLGIYLFTRTKWGYRYKITGIALFVLLTILATGPIFFKIGAGKTLDDSFAKKGPFYGRFFNPRYKLWDNPEKGMLTGKVLEINDDLVVLENQSGEWQIKINKIDFNFKKEEKIRIFGEKTGDFEFEAKKILPWEKPGLNSGIKGKNKMKEKR